ncbi:MAG: FAD-binding oxidoreductase [Pseudomonadota bacterium]
MSIPAATSLDLEAELSRVVGTASVLTEPVDVQPFVEEWRDLFVGRAAAVVLPKTVEEVSQLVTFALNERIPLVPQGGNTGLVGGQTPDQTGRAIVLSLSKLNRIREVDPVGNTMTVDAGLVLERAQIAADKVGRLFPLTLGSQGSCQIGGNLSTNAGGTGVLAYGNTRDLVLGLEVVLPDGQIWNGLSKLRKNNTGYDLKNLFIGAEGTLGVITGATLKLYPKPKGTRTAFVGLQSPQASLELLALLQGSSGNALTGFELMPRIGLDFVLRHAEGSRDPLPSTHPWYVLAEVSSGRSEEAAEEDLSNGLEQAYQRGIVASAAISQSLAQSTSFWAIRHAMSEVQKAEGGSIKHDVSVPVDAVPEFLERAIQAVKTLSPDCRPVPFGHVGDGNIHFNVSQPPTADREDFLSLWAAMNELVHGIVVELGGSISAEHGIGQLKRDLLPAVKAPVELELMRKLKNALDPNGLMNPGKLLP